jgi:hypothetical protein
MIARLILGAGLALALAGCAKSPADLAALACRKAVAERLGDKVYEMVDEELVGGYKPGDGAIAEISAPIYFDKGLPAETRQTLNCRVQFDPAKSGAEPAVIGMMFQW